MILRRVLRCAPLLAAFGAAATPASGEIYSFRDARGVTYFTNTPHLDSRYRLVYRGKGGAMRVPAYSTPRPADVARFAPLIHEAALGTGVDARLLHAVIRTESGYNPRAVSVKGARGLMQLLPTTARRYGVSNLFDPAQNIRAGASYLADLLAMFNNDLALALAAYNAGENAVLRAGNRIPDYPETRAYVPKVLLNYRKFPAPAAERLSAWR